MRLWRFGSATSRSVLTVAMLLVLAVSLLMALPPAGAAGEPVPPFEDETWRIDITHSDEYWLNVRYLVFPPGWSHDDRGFSGAQVTGHSGCGEAHAPLLLNTAYAAEGEHEIIVYFGGHCTHEGDSGEETKYDRYPSGTQIFVDATLERFLPGESSPIETIPVGGTVVVTLDAPPPLSLGAIAVSAAQEQIDATATTTSSSTTTEADGEASSASGEAIEETSGDSDSGVMDSLVALFVALVLGGAALATVIGFLVRRRMGWGVREARVDTLSDTKIYDSTEPGDDFPGISDKGASLSAEKATDMPESGVSASFSPQTGLESGVTYRVVEVPKSIEVVLDRPQLAGSEASREIPAGQYMVASPGPDGQTPIYSSNGTRLGVISNRDNPTLRLQNFDTGPRIDRPDPKNPRMIISIKETPGDYLVGPGDEHSAGKIYDATTGEELGTLYTSG